MVTQAKITDKKYLAILINFYKRISQYYRYFSVHGVLLVRRASSVIFRSRTKNVAERRGNPAIANLWPQANLQSGMICSRKA